MLGTRSHVILSSLELDKHAKRPRYNPQTLVRSVVRLRDDADKEPPCCIKSVLGFSFCDSKGHTLVGDIKLEPIVLPLPSIAPLRDTQLDVTNDGTLISPVNETLLGAQLPPEDPISMVNPPSHDNVQAIEEPVAVTPLAASHLPTDAPGLSFTPADSHIPVISQTQDGTDDMDSDDDASITSQADPVVAHNVSDMFQPVEDNYHAILSHRYSTGILELQVEYKTGCTEFLPYSMVQSDDPLAVAEYILASNLSCTKAEAHLARWARLFLRSVKKIVRRLLVIHQPQYSLLPAVQ